MADPLKLLREYIISNRQIKERDDYIIFGDTAFPKSAKTNHLVWSKKDEYYTLESLYFFYTKRSLPHTAYVKEAAAKNIQVVTRADRKGLEDYLTKEKLDSNFKPNIDHSAPIPPSVHISKLQAASSAAAGGSEHHHHHHNHADGPSDAKRARLEADKSKEKERLLQILDASTRTHGASAEDIRGLSDDLTKEKIAALRSKAIARKQKNIKSMDEDLDASAAPTDGAIGGVLGTDTRRYLDAAQANIVRELTKSERQWRTRTSVMEAATKNFAKSILPVLQALKIREEGGQSQPSAVTVEAPSAVRGTAIPIVGADSYAKGLGPARGVLSAQQQQGYNRYDQERFRKEETEGFKIDTMGTYHGITLKSITEGVKASQQASQMPMSSTSGQVRAGGISGYDADNSSANRPQKRVSRTPIIIIPAAGTSLVTMYNARDLLQDLKYVSTEDKKAQGARRENEVLIQRHGEGNTTVSFRIIDNPLKLTAEEWDRVIAVFVHGPAWQFKGWPWRANPVEIFEKVAAFHLKWDDVKLDSNVARWAVNVIQLSRNKRHLDRASLLKFWDSLNKHVAKNKPYLRH